MTAPSTFKFSLQCGAGGTWVEVTSDVLFEEGEIPFSDGRTSQFDGFGPASLSFTLTNPTGKYTPNNPSSTLAVPLSEGMGVCMELAGLLISGTIRALQLIFPAKESASKARVRITSDDMLGAAGRVSVESFAEQAIYAATPYLYWPLNDLVGSPFAVEKSGNNRFALQPYTSNTAALVFGVPGIPGISDTRVQLVSNILAAYNQAYTPAYTAGSMGWWGAWVTIDDTTVDATPLEIRWNQSLYLWYTTGVGIRLFDGSTYSTGSYAPTLGQDVYYSIGLTTTGSLPTLTVNATAYANGVSFATKSVTVNTQAIKTVSTSSGSGTAIRVSHLSHTPTQVHEEYFTAGTETGLLQGIAAGATSVTLDTLPTDLSTAPVTAGTLSGSLLDALNIIVRAEQGYMWVETSGTITAPVPKIKIVARNRERAVDYTFDVSEILDPIPFIHSLTNTVSQATAEGPTQSATYQDTTLTSLVGGASSSDSVPFRDQIDLYTFASDRVFRGINRGIAIVSITIDATSPNINRWTDLTAIRPGYRLSIIGLPITQLNYSTWDGFVVGREIVSTQDAVTDEPKTFFTFYLSPRVAVPVFDTDRFAADGNLTLTSNITNSATSVSVTSSDGTLFTTTGGDLPTPVRWENEVVSVTAVSGASSPQTFTVVRAQTDPVTGLATTAVAHNAGVLTELADPPEFTL